MEKFRYGNRLLSTFSIHGSSPAALLSYDFPMLDLLLLLAAYKPPPAEKLEEYLIRGCALLGLALLLKKHVG
jgi:hypothetical protein